MSLYDLGSIDPTRRIFNASEYYKENFGERTPLERIQRPVGDIAMTETVIDLTEEVESDKEAKVFVSTQ